MFRTACSVSKSHLDLYLAHSKFDSARQAGGLTFGADWRMSKRPPQVPRYRWGLSPLNVLAKFFGPQSQMK
jgi:hypothetical protein